MSRASQELERVPRGYSVCKEHCSDRKNMRHNMHEFGSAVPTVSSSELRARDCQERMNRSAAAPGCPVSWDQVLCWPPSSPGVLVVAPCLEELNGVRYDTSKNAMRWCFLNGSWANYTDYSRCVEILPGSSYIDDAVTMIFVVGFCVSVAALSIAVWIFLHFKDLKCLRNTIHTNLMFTYIFYDAAWILILYVQKYACSAMCGIFVAVSNYFYLTNFFWMFVEGLYLFLLVVATFTSERVKLRTYVLIGWGLPGVIVVTWAVAKHLGDEETPKASINSEMDLLKSHCPSIVSDHFDWIHQAPVIVVLAVNLIFLIVIMWVLITKLWSATTAETQQTRKAARALLVLFPLLGITYILTLQVPMDGAVGAAFVSIRSLLVGFQGFAVALFYCFLNTEVQNTLRHRVQRWREVRAVFRGRSKRWCPRSNTQSIRVGDLLYGSAVFGNSSSPYLKRESTASAATTTTLLCASGGACATSNGRLSIGSRVATCPLLPAEQAV